MLPFFPFVASAERHESIGSTNDRARQCAAEGHPLPRLIVADRQTAGRGRGANRWWTGSGSLAMSLLLPPEAIVQTPGQSSLVSLATGVAVIEAIAADLPDDFLNTAAQADRPARLGLHWPNDVMLDGRKLAGILVERLPTGHHVVGIGVNTNNTAADAPPELRDRIATLRDATGATHDHDNLLAALLRRFEAQLNQLRADGQEVARHANELCLQRGRTLTVLAGAERITGPCRGIAPDGALLLATPDGLRPCYTGIVQEER